MDATRRLAGLNVHCLSNRLGVAAVQAFIDILFTAFNMIKALQ
jgi:hypothetical protein